MSLFGTILEKLGFKKPTAQTAPKTQTAPAKPAPGAGPAKPPQAAQSRPAPQAAPAKPAYRPPQASDSRPAPSMPPARSSTADIPAAPAKPAPVPMVDVVGKLEKLAAENSQKLNWKVSIVDLLKLLDMDSSLQARKDLAVELGCPPELMGGDSANMNIWLHKTVLQKLAENGGNIPKELLD